MRKLLDEQGRKQVWLAKKADLSENSLQRILDDKGNPSATKLADLAVALEVSTDYLLGLTDDPTPRREAI